MAFLLRLGNLFNSAFNVSSVEQHGTNAPVPTMQQDASASGPRQTDLLHHPAGSGAGDAVLPGPHPHDPVLMEHQDEAQPQHPHAADDRHLLVEHHHDEGSYASDDDWSDDDDDQHHYG